MSFTQLLPILKGVLKMITVKNIYDFINSLAPFETQEKWDNSGMLVGDISKEVKVIAVCLDITCDTIFKAKQNNADVIISHHPVIFNPLKKILKGDIVFELLQSNISAICAHTNFDLASGGVNDVLAQLLGLEDISILKSSDDSEFLRIGTIKPMSPNDFAKLVATKLRTTVRLAKGANEISKVAVCGGSGCSFMGDVISANAHAFVTGDAKHNDFLDAKNDGLTLVAAGHYETENPSMPVLAQKIKTQFPTTDVVYIDSLPTEFVTC